MYSDAITITTLLQAIIYGIIKPRNQNFLFVRTFRMNSKVDIIYDLCILLHPALQTKANICEKWENRTKALDSETDWQHPINTWPTLHPLAFPPSLQEVALQCLRRWTDACRVPEECRMDGVGQEWGMVDLARWWFRHGRGFTHRPLIREYARLRLSTATKNKDEPLHSELARVALSKPSNAREGRSVHSMLQSLKSEVSLDRWRLPAL